MKIYKILPIVLLSILSRITAQNTFPATGNVGIGTSSPAYKLDVNGTVGIRSDLNMITTNTQIIGGFGAGVTSGTPDWNDISNARSGNGYTLLLGSATNGSGLEPSTYYHPFSFEYNAKNGSGNMTQFAIPYTVGTNSGKLHFRSRYGGVWSAWQRIPTQAQTDADYGKLIGTNNWTGSNTFSRVILNGTGADYKELQFRTGNSLRWSFFSTEAETGSNAGSNLTLNSYNDNGDFLNTILNVRRSSGNVGIGTSTPTEKLTINGRLDFNGDNTVGGTRFGMGYDNTNNYGWLQTWNSKPLYINPLGNNVIVGKDGGNVGIGTTTPTSKLDVNGAGGFSNNIVVKGTLSRYEGVGAFLSYETYGGRLESYDYSTTSWKNMAIAPNGGNVGIGTSTPTEKLTINGRLDFNGDNTVGGTRFGMGYDNTNNYGWLQTWNSKPLYINPLGNNVIVGKDGGNVGIGTTTPTSKLDVNGAGGFSNNIVVKGTLSRYEGVGAFLSYETYGGRLESYDYSTTSWKNMAIAPNGGNVGIGTASPAYKLDVNGISRIISNTVVGLILQNSVATPNYTSMLYGTYGINGGFTTGFKNTADATGFYYITPYGRAEGNDFAINNSGNIGIGTISPRTKLDINGNVAIGMPTDKAYPSNYKLAIGGNALAEKMVVKLQTNWPDYVFHSDYALPPLSQVEEHIKAKGHLLNIPTEKEVKETGIDLGDMNAKLLQKIEELTLYLIEIKKENELLKQRVKKLEDK